MSRVLIISQLGSLIAHEIRQPLAAIDAYAHGTLRFLEEGKMDSASVSRVMQLIQRQAAKAEEITPAMRNRKIRIIGGPLHGYEGSLVTVRGTTVKRLLVELPMLLAAAVEVEPEFIQLL